MPTKISLFAMAAVLGLGVADIASAKEFSIVAAFPSSYETFGGQAGAPVYLNRSQRNIAPGTEPAQ